MDTSLKALMAVTCLTVIVGVGYYIVRDQQSRPSQVDILRQQNDDLERRLQQ